MALQFFIFVTLLSACCAFILPADIEERRIDLQPGEPLHPTVYIYHDLPDLDQELVELEELPSEEEMTRAIRMKRQNAGRQPMPIGKHGQIEIYGEHRRIGGKNLGTDLNIQATGRLWQSRDGRSTFDANANYQRHFGGPSGTGRPNYGGGVIFNHWF